MPRVTTRHPPPCMHRLYMRWAMCMKSNILHAPSSGGKRRRSFSPVFNCGFMSVGRGNVWMVLRPRYLTRQLHMLKASTLTTTVAFGKWCTAESGHTVSDIHCSEPSSLCRVHWSVDVDFFGSAGSDCRKTLLCLHFALIDTDTLQVKGCL